MEEMMFWVGYFPTKNDFEKFMDQTNYLKWWSKDYEHNEICNNKSSLELRCQFCKELGINSYDSDFLIMKYLTESSDIQDFIDFIPTKNEFVLSEFERIGLKKANSLICYKKNKEISIEIANKTSSVFYLGIFPYQAQEIVSRFSTSGMKFSTFVGITNKSKEEFMKYFNQEDYLNALRKYKSGETKKKPDPLLRCQFCKDVGITHYYPQFLKIEFSETPTDALSIVKKVVNDKHFPDLLFSNAISEKKINYANCAFCYIANGFRDKNLDQQINIYMKDTPSFIKRKKKDIDELDDYNGLHFIGSFLWE